MKSGWWTEARSIEEKKWTEACGMQKKQLVATLGLLWKRVDKITSLDTKIDNEALALAPQSQVSFTNVEWDELKVYDTDICTSYISSGKLFFKPALPERPAGTVGGSESEIVVSLVRDFWTAIEYGGVSEFLGRLRNRGHRLIARWGEEILRETFGNQRNVEFNFGLAAVVVVTSPGIVLEIETTDQPNGECDLLESRTTASVRGATIHCTDNAERSCGSPATGGNYT